MEEQKIGEQNLKLSYCKISLKELVFIWLILVGITTVNAQQSSIKFGHLGLRDGLSQSDVSVIHQTNNGLLWFGTQDGLNRYNGFEFKVYSHDLINPTSISNNYIHCILEENDTSLWVGTENGLNLFNSGTQCFTNVFNSDKYKKRKIDVWALVRDSLGNLWIGTDKALYQLNIKTLALKKIDLKREDLNSKVHIRKMLLTEDNEILIATEGKGIIHYNIETEQVGVFQMKNTLLKSDIVWDIHQDSDGRIAIATNKGVNFFDRKKNRISSLNILDDVIKNNVVKTIFEDQSGVIWIGTENNGLFRLNSLSNIDHYE
jgi:two-component system sensor histidine kinase ChiS